MEELFARFPDMKPISKPPGLSTVNGIGSMIYGRRDYDDETGTYVKTLWFTLVFIPLIPLAAYRVADAPNGGWFFIGRVPVARGPKLWVLALLLLGLGIGGGAWWSHETGKPEYQAKRKLDRADELRKNGSLSEAARHYRQAAELKSEHTPVALNALGEMTDDPLLGGQDALAVFQAAWDVRHERGGVPNLFERADKFASRYAESDPDTALKVFELAESAAPTPEAGLATKQKLLEKLVKSKPGDLELTIKLAVALDRAGKRDRCEALLKPLEQKLEDTEGARILGQIYSQKGDFEKANAMLQPYTAKRLDSYLAAEREVQDAYNRVRKQAAIDVDTGPKAAPGFPFDQAKRASQAEQQELFDKFVMARIRDSADFKTAQETLRQRGAVVPVAFDLGIVQLRRAQQLADPGARKAELERAEKTFRSVQRQLGDSPQFRMELAQVYYWMGKQAEGRKLLDEVLKSEERKFEIVLSVASLLRNLGAEAESRQLSEEAHNNPNATPEQKQAAAMLRALTNTDLEDEIAWLEKADRKSPGVRATLASAKGQKAMTEGKESDAAAFYRESVSIYAGLPESFATLNNGGLASLALYGATGEKEALDDGVRKLEKAATLAPRDGILVSNVAEVALGSALRGLAGDKIALKTLKRQGSLDLFRYLHQDRAGRDAWVGRVKEDPGVGRAKAHFERALVLAPKSTRNYASLAELLYFLGDGPGLEALKQRAGEANLELEQSKEETRKFLRGEKDEKIAKEMEASIARAEKLVNETRAAGGATFAVAVASLVGSRLGMESLGKNVDAGALVKLAEEAHKAAPSSASAGTLDQALLARASQALVKTEPEYAAMAKRTQRSLSSSDLIAVALWREGKPREAALANEDVKRVLVLVRESEKNYPDRPDEWSWAMLKAAQPDEAAKLAEALKKDVGERTYRQLLERLSPLSAAHALRACWSLDLAGKHKEALEVLKRCAAEGVPMPFDVP